MWHENKYIRKNWDSRQNPIFLAGRRYYRYTIIYKNVTIKRSRGVVLHQIKEHSSVSDDIHIH